MDGSGGEPAGQRILLFRDTNGDGLPDQKTVLIDHLNSPFGVVLVGNDLYVADTDAVIRYPYTTGDTKITASGVKLCDLPGGLLIADDTGNSVWRVAAASP